MAALENLILLAHLAWSAWLYACFLRHRGSFAVLERWQVAYLPVYSRMGGTGGCPVPARIRLPMMNRPRHGTGG